MPPTYTYMMPPDFGWHHSSEATCLMRPRLFYMLFLVVSRIIMICKIVCHF